MKRKHDPLALTPHWHLDCRIESELPEDNVVGTRFLINAAFSAVALAALLFAGWLGYSNLALRYQTRDWEQRIRDNRAEVREIQRMQHDYAAAAAKVDQAYALVRPQFFVAGLLSDLGRTRPEPVVIDTVEWNDTGIVVRGTLRETSERAATLLRNYVDQLRRDEKIGPLFREIVMSDIERTASADALRFEISLRPKPPKS
jgi:hypothetical protein